MAVFWDVVPRSLADTDISEVLTASVKMSVFIHRPDYDGSQNLWNVGQYVPYNTAQRLRRKPSLN
jgi:hypothetical protein